MKQRKIYVLDTSVILHDGNAINNFEENDVVIPITVLEELDGFKEGGASRNFEARSFIRFLDGMAGMESLQTWTSLGEDKGMFKVVMPNGVQPETNAEELFQSSKADHKILNAAISLQQSRKEAKVTLVTKDINLRLKAKALGLPAEDYLTGKVDDATTSYTGHSLVEGVSSILIDRLFEEQQIPVEMFFDELPISNQYFILRNGNKSILAYYNPRTQMVQQVVKQSCYGVKPRNAEQAFAVHALTNPDIQLVTIRGTAGTGKTLLALAGSIEQRRNYRIIMITRPVVALGNKDIGFLPGDIQSKLNPYMEPLWDNLKFIKNQYKESDKNYQRIDEMVKQEKIMIEPLAYIRGRSLSNVIFIIDEAQNLTPHEIKTIITRAGEGTKLIFTGDIHQIDTPYLDTRSNGLSYVIEKMKGQSIFAHVTLSRGERSELANLASTLL